MGTMYALSMSSSSILHGQQGTPRGQSGNPGGVSASMMLGWAIVSGFMYVYVQDRVCGRT